jgi:3-oxoacyl-[acyl-carrier-protein] synthase III
MPTFYDDVFVSGSAYHLPGEAVDNAGMDAFIAPVNRMSERIKQRILADNGIRQRHYAINADGSTRISNAGMAAAAVRSALAQAQLTLADLQVLACGTSGGDAIMPGFANMVQGELAAPPMNTHTSVGVCASSIGALAYAAAQLQHGDALHGAVTGSDMPSRMFKASRFAPRANEADFSSHFLRWMLSDGAGALLLSRREALAPDAPRLALKWVHQKSFSGDFPVCMQLGLNQEGQRSYLDYDSSSAAEADGALSLRQDIRLLPNLFDIAIHEYAQLVQQGAVHPERVNHFLCHYSSERFRPVVDELMHKAQLAIAPHKWWSNLATRGNTGAASMWVMLAEFLQTREVKEGEQIFCFVPESGRFTVAYALFEMERPGAAAPQARAPGAARNVPLVPTALAGERGQGATAAASHEGVTPGVSAANVSATGLSARETEALGAIAPPHLPRADQTPRLAALLQALAGVWHGYRSQAWRTPLVQSIVRRQFTAADYLRWMESWVPQVQEGSLWMREAVASMQPPFTALSDLIEHHASDEQFDFKILFEDYQRAGGRVASLDDLKRNPGGEALNSYLHACAAQPSPVGLLGAIYIIEGTGQRIIPALLPLLQAQLRLPGQPFRFLSYHGANDENHLTRWLQAVSLVQSLDPSGAVDAQILAVARRCQMLYLMQWEDAFASRT